RIWDGMRLSDKGDRTPQPLSGATEGATREARCQRAIGAADMEDRGVACTWRIRHKLMLGLGLVAAVMALLLTRTLKGLLSYRATMRTFDSKLDELKEAVALLVRVKALGQSISDQSNQVSVLEERCNEAQEALSKYQKKLADTLGGRRDPNNGDQEKELV